MPPTRRKSGSARNAAQAQPTLSFNSKSARVTKPSTVDSSATKSASKVAETAAAQVIDSASGAVKPEEAEIETPEVPSKTQIPPKAKPVVKDEAELRAEKISDAQLRRYWKAEEDKRKAARVHQEALSYHEKILRHFDLSSQFGPCIGIPRLRRWRRAHTLGLKPPVEVLAVLLCEQEKESSMAYINELAGGKASGVIE